MGLRLCVCLGLIRGPAPQVGQAGAQGNFSLSARNISIDNSGTLGIGGLLTMLGIQTISVGGGQEIFGSPSGLETVLVSDPSYDISLQPGNGHVNVTGDLTTTFGIYSGATVASTNEQISAVVTNVSCSTSGHIKYSMPFQGATFKKVMAHVEACVGTASYTFPTTFSYNPYGVITTQSSSGSVTSISVSAITITGSGSTGMMTLEGY